MILPLFGHLQCFVLHDFTPEISATSTVFLRLPAAQNSFSIASLCNHVEIMAPPKVLLLLWELD